MRTRDGKALLPWSTGVHCVKLSSPSSPVFSLRTSDLDEARCAISKHFYANFLDLLEPSATLAVSFDGIQLGPVTLAELQCGAAVRMRLGELGAYHVDLPISGHLVWRQGGAPVLRATPARAAVFQPVGDTVLDRWEGDCRLVAVKIDRTELETRLAKMLDAPVRAPIRFSPSLDVSQGPGRVWACLVRLLAAEAVKEDGLAYHPLLGEQLRESLVGGLLLAADHQYRERLERPGPGHAPPRVVKRAMDAMQAHPERPFTTTKLAETAAISERWLQQGFQRHAGMSPMAYLRHVRLARAHEELRRSDPGQVTVAEVAYRWGFGHLGRFSASYQAQYGVSPSQTLRAPKRGLP
jgi:AraC-like DNA-binding protein